MSSYVITGTLGSGKSVVAVGRIFDYLLQGRKVATNLDIFPTGYLDPKSKRTLLRLPDKPTLPDLQLIGEGCESVSYDENGSPQYSEDQHGLLVLDELGTWFNCRNWQDKTRQPLLEWFTNARKLGWDTLFIIQDIDALDGQLRGQLAEHLVICKRLDRVKIPFLGSLLQQFGLKGTFPKVHRGHVHYGDTEAAMIVEKWTYIGRQFYSAYNTKQKFSSYYNSGVYSVLSPWHTKGRYIVPRPTFKQAWQAYLNARPSRFAPKPKHPLVEKIMRLPDPQKRLEFIRRFEQCGAFSRSPSFA